MMGRDTFAKFHSSFSSVVTGVLQTDNDSEVSEMYHHETPWFQYSFSLQPWVFS